MNSWSFTNLWNRSLETRAPRPVEKRDYLWASEFGNSLIDVYLKLNGEPYTNPPNPRSIRKFEAGNFWEAITKHILQRAGVPKDSQRHVIHQYPGLMKVTGRLDFVAGGKLDYEKALHYAKTETLWMPEGFQAGVLAIVEGLHAQFGESELKEIVLEVKSCSAYMMDAYEARGKGTLAHSLQAYHYLKGTGLDEAHVVYVCKDDCRMLEVPVYAGQLEDEYKGWITAISGYYNSKTEPPKENLIVFSEDTGKVSSNYKVEYSQYLTKLYGYQEPIMYRDEIKSRVSSFQRVIKRYANGDTITEKNEEVMDDLRNYLTQEQIDRAISLATKVSDEEETL